MMERFLYTLASTKQKKTKHLVQFQLSSENNITKENILQHSTPLLLSL